MELTPLVNNAWKSFAATAKHIFTKSFSTATLGLALAMTPAACGPNEPVSSSYGCVTDNDCKENRVCNEGRCVYPNEEKSQERNDECAVGDVQESYTGPNGTAGVGICQSKLEECVEQDEGTRYITLRDMVLPATEVCGNGLDDDCDRTDEGCANLIAFYSTKDPDGIHLMNIDGGNRRLLVSESEYVRTFISGGPTQYLRWSPDATKLAFSQYGVYAGYDDRMHVMNIDGSHIIDFPIFGSDLSWSPDGSEIAFDSEVDGNMAIHIMGADGTNIRRITDHAASPSWCQNDKIIFVSSRDGNSELYMMNADGSGLERITQTSWGEFDPDCSPDSKKVVFVSGRNGDTEIASLDMISGTYVHLTNISYFADSPSWSPDGRRIVFAKGEIAVINADGSSERILTNGGMSPAWSPLSTWNSAAPVQEEGCLPERSFYTGRSETRDIGECRSGLERCVAERGSGGRPEYQVIRQEVLPAPEVCGNNLDEDCDGVDESCGLLRNKIAFTYTDSGEDIFVIDPDGENQRNISRLPSYDDFLPAWSPDGRRIAFVSSRWHYDDYPNDFYGLYIMDTDGKNQVRVGEIRTLWGRPAWSPDGTKLIFYKEDGVYTTNLDGTDETKIAREGRDAAWSPDGRKILVAKSIYSFRERHDDIFMFDADGNNELNLTNSPKDDHNPAWSPDGRTIAFISCRDSPCGLYTMNAEGSNVRRITEGNRSNGYPSWSPDGTKIAFTSGGIYTVNRDGSNRRFIANGGQPAWSPR